MTRPTDRVVADDLSRWLKAAIDMLDESSSPFYWGSGSDVEWRERRDILVGHCRKELLK